MGQDHQLARRQLPHFASANNRASGFWQMENADMRETYMRRSELMSRPELTPEEFKELADINLFLGSVQAIKDASFQRRASQCKSGESPLVFSSE